MHTFYYTLPFLSFFIFTMGRIVDVYDNTDKLLIKLKQQLQEAADCAIQSQSLFKIGLSGGSLINQLAEILPTISTKWSKWRFFFCDERVVPFDNVESTYGAYRKAFRNIPVREDQFIAINPDLTADEAAKDYIKKLSIYFPPNDIPRFDVLLLGMGPDGHTCSLFPGHRLLDETSVWVAPITDSPKPPPSRITLTFPVINNAQLSIFVVVGNGKASVIKRILDEDEPLPAQRVQPVAGKVVWMLDKAAASLLP